MNIVHVSPNAPFNDGWGFQENLLPKYHAKLGHHVTLITTNQQFSPDGIITVKPGTFRSKDGFDVLHCRTFSSPKVVSLRFFQNSIFMNSF